MKWYKFDPTKGSYQKRPKERKFVLVLVTSAISPNLVCVGYLRNAAGDKQSPYFVTPSLGREGTVIAWCDCLSDEFIFPTVASL